MKSLSHATNKLYELYFFCKYLANSLSGHTKKLRKLTNSNLNIIKIERLERESCIKATNEHFFIDK